MKRILTYLAMALAAISVISCSESKRREALLPNISVGYTVISITAAALIAYIPLALVMLLLWFLLGYVL